MKIAALVFVAVLGVGRAARAADPLPTEIALARRLFAEARSAEELKDWATAANKLREAIAIKETAGLRFHLAYCEEQQGKLVEALVDYERSEDLPGGTNDDFRAQLPGKRASLHRRIPTVNLMLPPEAQNITLTVDGHVLPSSFLGKPVPLNPGRHVLLVTSPDYERFVTELNLKETDAVVSNALLTPIQKPAAPVPVASAGEPVHSVEGSTVSTSSSSDARTAVLIGEAAILVSGLAVGIGATLVKMSKDTQIARDQNILGPNGCAAKLVNNRPRCDELQQTTQERIDWALASEVGFVGAGVGLLSFATTLLLWPPARQTAGSTAHIGPVIGRPMTGLWLNGSF